MSYRYGMGNDAPPTVEMHQLHHNSTNRRQTEGRIFTSNHELDQLSPTSAHNEPPSLHPLTIPVSTGTPHRKNHSTKPRRLDSRKTKNSDGGTGTMTKELLMLLRWCRSDDWHRVLHALQKNPSMALETLKMGNHIRTTALHQAISSKGDVDIRSEVISAILSATPEAAKLANGYGSLPIHAIAQRNVKMDSQTKERFMIELVNCYKDALTSNGGTGGRTPLHIIFTDYVSPKLTKFIIENCPEACFMTDNKLCLPAHIACMRHCSPEKLRMLLAVNPAALRALEENNRTLLDLAKEKATEAHPNYALIDELQKQLAGDVSHYDPIVFITPLPQISVLHAHPQYSIDINANVESTPAVVSIASHQNNVHQYSSVYPPYGHTPTGSPPSRDYHYHWPHAQQPYQHYYYPQPHSTGPYQMQQYEHRSNNSIVGRVSSEDDDADAWNQSRIDSNETWVSPIRYHPPQQSYYPRPYSHHQDGRDLKGTTELDHRHSDGGRFTTHRYSTPDNVHVHTPPELSFVSHPQDIRDYDASTPLRQRISKSSTKSEEPAAKLLLHFSRNWNSNADDKTANKMDDNDSEAVIDCLHKEDEGYNHFDMEYPAHRGSRNIDSRDTTDLSMPANACSITEV